VVEVVEVVDSLVVVPCCMGFVLVGVVDSMVDEVQIDTVVCIDIAVHT
jgi:hypothetical protein